MGEEGRTMIPKDRGRNEKDMAFSGLGSASHSKLQWVMVGWIHIFGEKGKQDGLWVLDVCQPLWGETRDFRR